MGSGTPGSALERSVAAACAVSHSCTCTGLRSKRFIGDRVVATRRRSAEVLVEHGLALLHPLRARRPLHQITDGSIRVLASAHAIVRGYIVGVDVYQASRDRRAAGDWAQAEASLELVGQGGTMLRISDSGQANSQRLFLGLLSLAEPVWTKTARGLPIQFGVRYFEHAMRWLGQMARHRLGLFAHWRVARPFPG